MKKMNDRIGFITPEGNKWIVTCCDGCFYECKSQDIAMLLSGIEENKNLLRKILRKLKF